MSVPVLEDWCLSFMSLPPKEAMVAVVSKDMVIAERSTREKYVVTIQKKWLGQKQTRPGAPSGFVFGLLCDVESSHC